MVVYAQPCGLRAPCCSRCNASTGKTPQRVAGLSRAPNSASYDAMRVHARLRPRSARRVLTPMHLLQRQACMSHATLI